MERKRAQELVHGQPAPAAAAAEEQADEQKLKSATDRCHSIYSFIVMAFLAVLVFLIATDRIRCSLVTIVIFGLWSLVLLAAWLSYDPLRFYLAGFRI